MELAFTFRNIESTDAIRTWAQKRFQKVEKLLEEGANVHLTLSVDKHRHRADVTFHAYGEVVHASDETDDMYQTLDSVMSKMEHAARTRKEKAQRHHG